MSSGWKSAVGFVFGLCALWAVILFAGGLAGGGWAVGGALVTLGVLVWGHYRPERHPDVLRALGYRPFEREGLCFVPRLATREGAVWLELLSHNRYSRPVQGRIALKPKRIDGLPRLEPIVFDVTCPGLAVCIQGQPLPGVPLNAAYVFQVLGSVEYPQRKGHLGRFRDGLPVGSGGAINALTVAALAGGLLILNTPARIELGVEGEVVDRSLEVGPESRVLWTPEEGATSALGWVERLRTTPTP